MERAQMSIDGWMDKEDVVYTHIHTHTHTGVLLGNQKEWNLAICNYTDGTGGYYAKWNYSVTARQISYDFTHMRTLRDKTDEHKGRETKIKTGRGTKHKRLWNMENKQRVTRGFVGGEMG